MKLNLELIATIGMLASAIVLAIYVGSILGDVVIYLGGF